MEPNERFLPVVNRTEFTHRLGCALIVAYFVFDLLLPHTFQQVCLLMLKTSGALAGWTALFLLSLFLQILWRRWRAR